jgi:PAS domain S-box-containing protein
VGFAVTDLEGRYVHVNPAFCRLLGRDAEALLSVCARDVTHPVDYGRQMHYLKALKEGSRETYQMEKRYLRPDGSEVWVHLHSGLLRDEKGRPRWHACQAQDISDRVASERALARTLDRFGTLLASLDQGVIEVDAEGGILYGNHAAAEILGLEEELLSTRTLWSPLWKAVDRDGAPLSPEQFPLVQVLRTRRPIRGARMGLQRLDGQVAMLLLNAVPLFDQEGRFSGAVATFTDETEVLKREKALFQAQKLESLGLLAGGIAHDFNNLLGALLMNLGLARTMAEPETNLARHLEVAEGLAEKSADLTRQLLAYAGRSKPKTEPLDLSALVSDMGRLLKASMPKTLELATQLEGDLPVIRGERAQLQQVVLNLITNAADAMGEGPGRILLEVRRADPRAPDTPPEARDLGGQELIRLSVIDQGCGMDEATLSRIFDPFFTTKARGRGLGLVALQGIVRAHGGVVTVESRVGSGTTFRLWFPALETAAGGTVAVPQTQVDFSGEGLVLVVDDEAAVREVATELLRNAGFRTLEARDGVEGLELFSRHREEIRLVLLDLAMPRMGGLEAYEAMRVLDPEVRVLLSSGFAPQVPEQDLLVPGRVEFLPKPYRIQELMARVQAMLEARGAVPRE